MEEIKVIEKDVKKIETSNNSLFLKIKNLEIVDERTFGIAANFLKTLKETAKEIEEREKEFTKPLNDTLKKIRDVFRPQKDAIEEMKGILEKEKILPYQRELERVRREEAEKKRQAEIDRLKKEREEELKKALEEKTMTKKEIKAEEKAVIEEVKIIEKKEIKIETGIKTSSGSMNIRKTWTFEIIDFEKVPRTYCEPSKSIIDDAIKSGVRDIIGIRIFEKETIVSR